MTPRGISVPRGSRPEKAPFFALAEGSPLGEILNGFYDLPSIQMDNPVGSVTVNPSPDKKFDGALKETVSETIIRWNRVPRIILDTIFLYRFVHIWNEDAHV
jgi:hypothetical protein